MAITSSNFAGAPYASGQAYIGSGNGNGLLVIAQNSSAALKFSAGNSTTPQMILTSAGYVGITTTSPSYPLDVGTSSSSGAVMRLQNSSGACTHSPGSSSETVSCSSDLREKSNIVNSSLNALDWIAKMRIRDFVWNATGEHKTGVVAQELKQTHPAMVHKGSDEFLTVDEPNPWILIKAIQEQQQEIADLKKQIRTLAYHSK